MPRQKFNKYGEIIRTYLTKCPGCGERYYVTFEEFECPTCKMNICPNCLKPLKGNTHKYESSTDNGHSLTVTCTCGYDVVDTEW